METLKVALDWTPNTIHAGLYLAEHLGYFAEVGLAVELIPTDLDNYSVYPIEKLRKGWVDIAMGPTEHLFYNNAKADTPRLAALATVFRRDMSSFVTRLTDGITRPSDLDGKTIGCYGTYFETELITAMIKNDGGIGEFEVVVPNKLELWNMFMEGKVDACWVFDTWEAIDARMAGSTLNYLKLGDYGIPYGHSPIFMVAEKDRKEKSAQWDLFIQAVEKGYQFAALNTTEAANLLNLKGDHKNWDSLEMLLLSLQVAAPNFLDENGSWGKLNDTLTQNWKKYLVSHNLLGGL